MKARVFMFTDIESAQIGGPDLFRAWGSQDRPNRGRNHPAAVLKADSSLRRTLFLKEISLEGTGRKNAVLGIRGGSWNNESSNLRVSDRNNAGNTNADRNNNYGVRAARTTSPAGFYWADKSADYIYGIILSRLNLDSSGKREKDEDV